MNTICHKLLPSALPLYLMFDDNRLQEKSSESIINNLTSQRMTLKPVELEIKVPWGHVAALAWGSPSSRPVLLVHGSLDNAGSFRRLIPHLPTNFYYVAIDLPSHGLSSHFPQGLLLDFFNFVLSIHYILDELKWQKCLYIGHSFGAQLGIAFSVLYPERIEKIIAIDAIISKSFEPKYLIDRLKYIFDQTLISGVNGSSRLSTKDELMDILLNKRQFVLNKEAAEALFDRGTIKIGDKYKFSRDLRMRPIVTLYFTLEQNLEFVKRLSVPVLLIVAEETWFSLLREGKSLELLKNNLSPCLTVVHVDGNHDVHNNYPENVAPLVASFLKEQSKL